MEDLEFPLDYSQSACDIIASKYFRKKGVPNGRGHECSMREVAHRMVSFWVNALYDEVMISKEQSEILYDELVYAILAQMWAPNSPQWFNTGLKSAYGIEGPAQGHYYYDEESEGVVKSLDSHSRTQGSACFIVSVSDSLLGSKSLTDLLVTETLLFKYGSGVGANWSPIRGKNELLSGGGKSSGLLSFLKVSDRNAGAIKSGGTTRRAAKMNILDIDHPEILDFISWKAKEEDKALALGKMGYSLDMDGEAYETVSGQNANNSIRVTDEFMRSLADPDSEVMLKGRVESTPDSSVKASLIWDETAKAAWRCGDPGIQFDDTINSWHTCPRGEDGNLSKENRINASNPCSEYMFLDDTACNLASINLLKFYDPISDAFDIPGYRHLVTLVQLALEATIYWGQFPTADIARRSYMFRSTGLGFTNLGALLMSMGLAYDSHEARTASSALLSLLTGESYHTSALMAEKVGPFPCHELNKEHMRRVLRNHARAASSYDGSPFEDVAVTPQAIDIETLNKLGYDNLAEALRDAWSGATSAGLSFGYRNAQVSVLAPTGTIAFAMDCSTTSAEPFFSHVAYKKLTGGGFMVMLNPAMQAGLKRLGYSDPEIGDIMEYVLRKDEKGSLLDGKIEEAPHLKPEHLSVFDTASECGSGKRCLSPVGHVLMMGALAPHVSGAISKTVNLPKSATVDDIKGIYTLSWELGVKAVALYRDGCKSAQPLSANNSKAMDKPLADYTYAELIEYINSKTSVKPQRIKPSGIRRARVHEAAINGLKLYITTSFYEDGRLGELYVSSGRQGSLTKGLLDSLSTTISEMLQYGVPPQGIAKMYRGQKYEPSGIVTGHPFIKFVDSISDLISKIIDIELGDFAYCQVKPTGYEESHPKDGFAQIATRKYNAGDYLLGDLCPSCGSSKMVKNGTCKVCTECGTTTGCS
jgi:ribonucleoside-diphosphate reductase alpha chain